MGQLLLDGPRRHRLAVGVLVDVFDAVHDLVVAALPLPEDVPRGEPVLVVGGRRGIAQVPGHIMSPDLQLPFRTQASLQPRQGHPHRVVLVGSGLGHGDAPRGLRHPEPAAELHAVALEEVKGRRLEGSRRRQSPAEPIPHHATKRMIPPGTVLLPIHLRQAAIPDLLPSSGNADESRGPHLLKPLQEGLQGRVTGEDVGPSPEEHPRHLQVPAEGVIQREEAEEDLAVSYLRQGRRPCEPLGDEVVDGVLDPLGPPGTPGGEHDRGQVHDAPAGPSPQDPVRFRGTHLGHLLRQPGLSLPRGLGIRIQEKDTK